MSRPIIAVALLGAALLTVFAFADEQQPQTQQPQTQQQAQAEKRDGRWLRAGIAEYQRYNDKAANQSLAEVSRGVGTVFYIRGVLDAMWSTAYKAQVQENGSQRLEELGRSQREATSETGGRDARKRRLFCCHSGKQTSSTWVTSFQRVAGANLTCRGNE